MKHKTYIDSLGRNDYRIMCTCGWVMYCKLTRRDTELTAREHRAGIAIGSSAAR